MDKLQESRKKINSIDAEMLRLFQERMEACKDVAEYKKEHALSVKDPAREAELINRNRSMISNADVESYYIEFMKKTIDLSCAYQSRLMNGLRVAYAGVEGAFAYIAAKKMFPEAELIACSNFTEAYKAVEEGVYDSVVLPLENSYAGEVGTVMDLMFSGNLFVNQVVDLDIVHHLLANDKAELKDIRKVVSHPQALAQCDEYIRSHGWETVTCSNTAVAAKQVKEMNDPSIAAIASSETADIFSLKVLDSHINSSRSNTTRFAAFSRAQNRPAPAKKREDENFILVFTVQNEAGSLAQTLNIIGAHGFNMRNLRSRPMKGLLWNYFFYIEAEGNINTENGRDMLQELSAICAKLRLVGSYYANNIN